MSLQVGLLVKLKSGGPEMTVVDISSAHEESELLAGKVKCQWFQYNDAGYQVLAGEWFPPASLNTV